ATVVPKSPEDKVASGSPEHFDEDQAAIKPNVWYSMLRWKPKVLSFPGTPSKLDWAAGQPLWIHCGDAGLVSLGRAKRPGFQIRVKLRQETWHGLFGVFVGYQKDTHPKAGPFCRYQLFKFHRTLASGKPQLAVIRSHAQEFDFQRLG